MPKGNIDILRSVLNLDPGNSISVTNVGVGRRVYGLDAEGGVVISEYGMVGSGESGEIVIRKKSKPSLSDLQELRELIRLRPFGASDNLNI